jgi:hypothetical protein
LECGHISIRRRYLLPSVHHEDGGSTFGHRSTEVHDITSKTITKPLPCKPQTSTTVAFFILRNAALMRNYHKYIVTTTVQFCDDNLIEMNLITRHFLAINIHTLSFLYQLTFLDHTFVQPGDYNGMEPVYHLIHYTSLALQLVRNT